MVLPCCNEQQKPTPITLDIMKQQNEKRTRVSQEDVPAYSLNEALRVGRAIYESYAKAPTSPLRVASAMEMTPSSGPFRMLCGASIAYGLTIGGCWAVTISLTPLALRILHPSDENDQLKAKREAFLKPLVIKGFVDKYKGSPLPKDQFALNILEDLGVPRARTAEVYKSILSGLEDVGLIREIKGKKYIDPDTTPVSEEATSESEEAVQEEAMPRSSAPMLATAAPLTKPANDHLLFPDVRAKRVFITHGKNKAFVDPIKKLLQFGEMEAVVSVEKQSVSEPVPDKVMNDMRSCGAAIIHVEGELKLLDAEANEHVMLNPNVLIEIGAAMALYGKRFILLVKEGVKLPSNLQGLYEVRYKGESLDGDVTIKLLEAINDLKRRPLVSAEKSESTVSLSA